MQFKYMSHLVALLLAGNTSCVIASGSDCVSDYIIFSDIFNSKSMMLEPEATQVICEVLENFTSPEVLEWGSGVSTLAFSNYASRWLSIEHDLAFGDFMINELQKLDALAPKGWVDYLKVRPDKPWDSNSPIIVEQDGTPSQFASYCNAPADRFPSRAFDVVILDGRARVACAAAVLRDRLLRGPSALVVIHDFERPDYHAILHEGWFEPVLWDPAGPGLAAVLRPMRLPPQHLPPALPPRPASSSDGRRLLPVLNALPHAAPAPLSCAAAALLMEALASFPSPPTVLEWAAGGHTAAPLAADRAAGWLIVEHDPAAADRARAVLAAAGGAAAAAEVLVVPPDGP